MRNLKRALSLTLASVMLLGMMVVGSSAAGYPDVSEEENIEAIEVLQAVGVMGGDENGNFNPDDYVTREQMAVIMAQLLKLDYNYYKGTNPFSDVPEWAAPYVAACAANGVTAGIGGGLYGSKQNIQAVQAALMMLKALGYFQYAGDYGDSYILATVKQGTEIGLFKGIDSNADSPLTRNEVAQMALNALQADMVSFTGDPGATIPTANGDVVIGYRAEYTPRTSTLSKYQAIEPRSSDVSGDTNHRGQYYIQLGEELYDGDLKLNSDATDDFERPARKWEYNGKAIGTYMKKELLDKEWTVEVTGKDLYDLLGADTIKTYDVIITIDGVDTKAEDAKTILDDAWFSTADMNRNNNKGVGSTGKGVLTQVFVDDDKNEVTVAIINTYLAFADEDYDERTEEIDITAYGLDVVKEEYVKTLTDKNDNVGFTLPLEDFAMIANLVDGDPLLVTVAEGTVQSVAVPEVISAAEITAFKKDSNLTVNGTKYDYSDAAEYDWEVLNKYTGDGTVNLKDIEYNVYLDKYNYAIGVDVVEAVNNYVFITAIQRDGSHLSNLSAEANAIFLDGTMETININVAKSSLPAHALGTDSILNTWCTYSVTNDVYTVKEVAQATAPAHSGGAGQPNNVPGGTGNATKLAQAWTPAQSTTNFEINRTHLSLNGGGSVGAGYNRVYGNDDTVYITVKLDELDHNSDSTDASYGVISEVNNVVTGVRNADIKVWSVDEAHDEASDGTRAGEITKASSHLTNGVYALYGRDGYVIAAVVAGDDGASTKNLVYVHSSSIDEESYEKVGDKWSWHREVTLNGQKTTITEVSDSLTYLNNMQQHHWYQVRYNSKNEVIGISEKAGAEIVSPFTAVPTWSLKTATGTAKADTGDYVPNITLLEASLDEYDNILYEQKFENDHPTMDDEKGNTLFVNTTDKEGLWVNDDVNILLVQYRNNKLETTFTSGASRLEKIVRDLNTKNGTSYDYTISAIVNGTGATAVIIYDRTNTYARPEEEEPEKPSTSIDGIFVDLTATDDVMVNSTKAFDTQDGYDAIIAALKDNGYEVVKADETAANKLEVVTMKNGIGRTFKWDAAGADKCVTGKEFKLNGVPMITNATAYPEVDDAISRFIGTASGDEYIRYSNDGGKSWTYGLASATGVALGTTAAEVETGYLKVTVNSAAVTDAQLDLKNSGIETDGNGDTYAKGTSKAVKGTAATGTGMKVGTSDYMPYDSTFADIHAKDTTNAGVCTITDVASVKLTIVNDTVGSEGTSEVAQAYNTTAQNLSSLTGINGTGTHKYVGSRTGTAETLATTVDVSKDVTVYVGYVETGAANVSGTFTGVDVRWDNELTGGPIMKVGTKITATVTFNKPTIANSALSLKASAGKTGGYSCDDTGLTNVKDSATKWTTDTYSVAVADSDKMEGSIKITFTLDVATAAATPTLTISGGT